ncbi:MAG: hypothetical protein ACQEST_09960 [Bacteroidota bacterium]
MKYIAALDYDHLDNGVFLTTLARSLSQQQSSENVRSFFIHTDSEYTERIIQTGVMRREATIRSIKDLNNRLVALFADQGVSTIGINPYQRKLIVRKKGSLKLDHSFLDTLPHQSTLLLSTLVFNADSDEIEVITLPELLTFLQRELNADELFIFSKSEESELFTTSSEQTDLNWETLDEDFRSEQLPDEFAQLNSPVRLTNARDFNQIPNLEHAITITTNI